MTQRTIGEIIRDQTLISLPPEASLWEAADKMKLHEVGSVLVVQEGKLIGIFTERDLVRLMAESEIELNTTPIEDVMTANPDAGTPDMSTADALWYMDRGGFRHLPIVDANGAVLGVVSRRDFF